MRPNKEEIEFLNLAINKFFDIFDEITENDSFWVSDSYYRFNKIKDAFYIYGEIQLYEQIKWYFEYLKNNRPPMENIIASSLFKTIRNILVHFPFFNSWDEVYVTDSLINWNRPNQSIFKFLNEYLGHEEIKYRVWEEKKKKMTYLSINFPKNFDEKIYLNQIISEKEGILFSLYMMKQVVCSCLEN